MYRIHGHLTKKITWTLRYQGAYNNETLLIMHLISNFLGFKNSSLEFVKQDVFNNA